MSHPRTTTSQAPFPRKSPKWFLAAVAGPFADFFRRYGLFALLMLSFIVVYRLSDYVLGHSCESLLSRYRIHEVAGLRVSQNCTDWASALIGIGAGGWAILKFGLSRSLIAATVLIAATNLFFALIVVNRS